MENNTANDLLIKGRDRGIECLRGIAIILMVAGHVIGSDQTNGLKIDEDSELRYFYYLFEYLRMPLFTVISGFVYAMKPLTPGREKIFLERKVSRLLVPFFFAATFFCFFQAITPGTNAHLTMHEFWKPFVFPYAQFWFVQGMFVVFVLVAYMERHKMMNSIINWLLLFFCSLVLFLSDIVSITFFSIDRVPFLLMFFLLGLGMKRFYRQLFHNKALLAALSIVFALSFGYQQFIYHKGYEDADFMVAGLTVLVGISGAFTLIRVRFNNKPLAWLGNYSYEIFLYHPFGTAGGRILLKLLGVNNISVYFVTSLFLGLSLPIAFRLLCNRAPYLTKLLFGERLSLNKKKSGVPDDKEKETSWQTVPAQ